MKLKRRNKGHIFNNFWPTPKIRSVGFFSDSSIYAEVIHLSSQLEYFTKVDLKKQLVNHVKGLTFKGSISDTAIDNLVKELQMFGWIGYYFAKGFGNIELNFNYNNNALFYSVTEEGKRTLELFQKNKSLFYEQVASELFKLYTIPGWFIQRLWDLNMDGQGEIVIPSPVKKWNPQSKDWHDNEWNNELDEQVDITYSIIDKHLSKAFPIDFEDWKSGIIKKWTDFGSAEPRRNELSIEHVYTPRKRLALAMKDSSIRMIFKNANPRTLENDFLEDKPPLQPRTYSYWCTRLEEIGLLNYTDYNPIIPGRIIYPVGKYKNRLEKNLSPDFRHIESIFNTRDEILFIYRPKWERIKIMFFETLYEEYKRIYLKVKSLYISVQDLRDEVCRVLRLSGFLFDQFLNIAVSEALVGLSSYRISIETDIREDQLKTFQRRPVYLSGKIVSLIAITNK